MAISQQRCRAAWVLKCFGAHLVPDEQDDQHERDHHHATRGEYVEEQRRGQVVTRSEAVKDDSQIQHHGFTIRSPRWALVDSHSMSKGPPLMVASKV